MKISQITVPEDRQRAKVDELEDLAASLSTIGQLNPVIVDKDNKLVAGERRYRAALLLGWTDIEAKCLDSLSKSERHLVELDENIQRKNLTWQEESKAISEYHRLKKEENPEWTAEETSLSLAMSPSKVSTLLQLSSSLDEPEVKNNKSVVTAYNKLKQKKQQEAMKLVASDMPKGTFIHNTDFITWVGNYRGPLFNFIHCDFPYGIDHSQTGNIFSGKVGDNYDDSQETYDNLVIALLTSLPHISHPQCNILFWCSAKHTEKAQHSLREAGFVVDTAPLIWHKPDGSGVSSDPKSRPKHIYETAIYGYRGGRLLCKQGVADLVTCPVANNLHRSEKPLEVLRHFLPMFVDSGTFMLDPTMGCGNALKVAKELGAPIVTGVELSEETFKIARTNLCV